MPANGSNGIQSFALHEGRVIADKYEVISQLGTGWEGEVYLIRESSTGIERAAKLFFPHRNPSNRTARRYAIKLHKLRHCDIVIHYVSQETISFHQQPVTVFISEFVEGRATQ